MPGKEQIMDMTVNRLPARTWNWLKMNETVLSSVEPFRQQEIPEGNVFRKKMRQSRTFLERLKPVWGRIWINWEKTAPQPSSLPGKEI